MSKLFKYAASVGLLAMLSACGGPANVEDVEAALMEDFSEGDAEVTWINVVEDDEGEFTATLDITDPEEETGSRTAVCDVSATSTSSSRTCQSLRPSLGAQITAQMEEYLTGRNADIIEMDMQRNETDPNFAGHVLVTDRRTSEQIRMNCTATVSNTGFDWNCDPV